MKLKGSAKQFSVKTMLITLIAGTAALVPLRVYQLLTMVEDGTGFWKVHNFAIPLFYTLLAALFVVSIVFAFIGAGTPNSYSKKPNTLVGAGSLILAVTMVIDAATQFWNFFNIVFNWQDFSPSEYSQLSFLLRSSSFALPIEGVFAIFGALYFMLLGLYYLNNSRSVDNFKILAVMPVFWLLMQLIYRFARTINFINVSELLLELFILASAMVFFLNFSRIMSGVCQKESYWTVYAFGVPTAVLGFVCSVPRLLLTVIGKGAKLTDGSPFTLWHLAVALFICFCLFTLFEKVDEPVEETQQADGGAQLENAEEASVIAEPVMAPENIASVKQEPKKEEAKASPKVAAPVVEKFSMEALENNKPAKQEPKKEEVKASPKVAAPVVEKFSMEALENNKPAKQETKKEEVKASPKVAAPVVEKFSMEALENNKPVNQEFKKADKSVEDGERFSLEAFVNSDAFQKDEEPVEEEIEHFDLEAFLANLEDNETK